jgi:hypothetical protein
VPGEIYAFRIDDRSPEYVRVYARVKNDVQADGTSLKIGDVALMQIHTTSSQVLARTRLPGSAEHVSFLDKAAL